MEKKEIYKLIKFWRENYSLGYKKLGIINYYKLMSILYQQLKEKTNFSLKKIRGNYNYK